MDVFDYPYYKINKFFNSLIGQWVYHSNRKKLLRRGVIFFSLITALYLQVISFYPKIPINTFTYYKSNSISKIKCLKCVYVCVCVNRTQFTMEIRSSCLHATIMHTLTFLILNHNFIFARDNHQNLLKQS